LIIPSYNGFTTIAFDCEVPMPADFNTIRQQILAGMENTRQEIGFLQESATAAQEAAMQAPQLSGTFDEIRTAHMESSAHLDEAQGVAYDMRTGIGEMIARLDVVANNLRSDTATCRQQVQNVADAARTGEELQVHARYMRATARRAARKSSEAAADYRLAVGDEREPARSATRHDEALLLDTDQYPTYIEHRLIDLNDNAGVIKTESEDAATEQSQLMEEVKDVQLNLAQAMGKLGQLVVHLGLHHERRAELNALTADISERLGAVIRHAGTQQGLMEDYIREAGAVLDTAQDVIDSL
jgi:hypothetical protein